MSSHAGGIIGGASSSTVTKCYNIGNILNGQNAQMLGGIAGTANTIESSYNSGNLNGNHIGGISGYAKSVTNSHNEGSLTGAEITEHYAYMGQILGYTGSIAGEGCTYCSETDSINNLDITNSATKLNSKIMTMDFILGKLNEYANSNSGLKSWSLNDGIPSF